MSNSKVNKDGTVGTMSFPWRDEPEAKDLKDFYTEDGKEVFKKLLKFYQDHMVYQKNIEYIVDTLYDMGSFHMDKWDSTKYLGYFGAGNEKGKSTALRIHKYVSYRGCPVSTGTDAAFRKSLEEGGTLIIDQAENIFYQGSNRNKTFMYNVFTSGYTRDFFHIQLDAESKKDFDCKRLYGAKIYCMQDDGKDDNPIKQRTYPHYMQQGVPKVVNMLRNEKSMETADWIFKNLHALRLKKYKPLHYDSGLFGRSRELWEPDLNIIELYNLPAWVEKKIYIQAFEDADKKRDQASDTLPAEIYYAIPQVMKTTKQFTATHIKSYLLQTYNNKYTDKNLYEGKIGKYLHELMGLQNRKLGGKRIYDMNDPTNISIVDSLRSQYDIMNSIEIQCLNWEAENDITPDTTKSVYERWADYRKYKSMQELARDIHKNSVTVPFVIIETEPEPEPEPEIEYNCPGCGRLIIGCNPNIVCESCGIMVEPEDPDQPPQPPIDE